MSRRALTSPANQQIPEAVLEAARAHPFVVGLAAMGFQPVFRRGGIWETLKEPTLPPELLRLVVPLAAAIGSTLFAPGYWTNLEFSEKLGMCWTADAMLSAALSIADGKGLPE